MVIIHSSNHKDKTLIISADEQILDRLHREKIMIGFQKQLGNRYLIWINPMYPKPLSEIVNYLWSWGTTVQINYSGID